jgi:hypothetical protein
VNPFNPSQIYATAAVGGTRRLLRSIDGGSTWASIGTALFASFGGPLYWNYANSAGLKNKDETNLLILRGKNASGGIEVARGPAATGVVAATSGGSDYLSKAEAIQSLSRSLNFVRLLAKTNPPKLYLSENSGATWPKTITLPGGTATANGLEGWPASKDFVLVYGGETLGWTIDATAGTPTYTSIWSDYNTWRSSNWGSEGTLIAKAWPDLRLRYPQPINPGTETKSNLILAVTRGTGNLSLITSAYFTGSAGGGRPGENATGLSATPTTGRRITRISFSVQRFGGDGDMCAAAYSSNIVPGNNTPADLGSNCFQLSLNVSAPINATVYFLIYSAEFSGSYHQLSNIAVEEG